jgi:TolB-like protein
MRRFARVALALAMAAVAAPNVFAQAKPVVAVLPFDNNSVGKDAADYNGAGKGMAELMTNDLLSNPNVVVVERERIQALLVEQNLTKDKTIDPATAIRLGKIIGAQYVIYGAFMSDGRGNFVLTGKTVNVETSVIANPTRVNSKGDDVLGMIAQLTSKLATEMKIPALRVGDAGPAAVPAGQPVGAAPTSTPAVAADAKAATPAPSAAKPAEAKPVQVAQAKPTRKMDMKTAMLYSKALEAEDAGNRAQALELYRKVDVAFPSYAPVQSKINRLARG